MRILKTTNGRFLGGLFGFRSLPAGYRVLLAIGYRR
jgi:hypothetical protein